MVQNIRVMIREVGNVRACVLCTWLCVCVYACDCCKNGALKNDTEKFSNRIMGFSRETSTMSECPLGRLRVLCKCRPLWGFSKPFLLASLDHCCTIYVCLSMAEENRIEKRRRIRNDVMVIESDQVQAVVSLRDHETFQSC